ncbi:hypothetical protein [Rhodopseudomonas sp. BR0M22]|uniref:hypothetical protein n=1 Tax=Rhodopseudomonas sp. BR0M22 TaxID=2269369 RepID=UPI0019675163|nr:hypothetical protein [Rhodopseudomonas sp. BR0M22]
MDTIIQHLALVSESKLTSSGDLMRVAAALQKQASRDVAPIWNVSATIDAFEKLEDVPLGYWPLIVKDDIGYPAAGIHLDNDRQPFALISSSQDLDTWSLTASHETLEMLVDPYGDRLIAGDSPKQGQGRVSFLVEVCDPSEAAEFAYTCNSILVSDFYTPRFFDPLAAPGVRYSFTGAITEPRQVLRGGYLSWVDSVTNHWWQETWFGGSAAQFRDIGKLDAKSGSLRSQIDRLTSAETAKVIAEGRTVAAAAGLTAAIVSRSTNSKAAMWREQISQLAGQPRPSPDDAPQRRAAPRILVGD